MAERNMNKPQDEEEKKRKKKFVAWWDALPKVAKIASCSVAGLGVISAVVFPTLAATVWKKPNQPKEWYEDESYINGLTVSDIGTTEKDVVVNGQVHKVRLIGIGHDEVVNDKGEVIGKARTTWEFANLISDSDGNSLAYLWNDTNDGTTANHDYINSSIHYALTGSGNNNGHGLSILAGVKGNTNWESNYKDKTILSMLPKGLTNNLKTVKKTVGNGSAYTETSYTDKLFMLSPIEMGYTDPDDKGYGTTYKYYENATTQPEAIRIKKQVNNSEVYISSPQIPNGSGQAYQNAVYNYAGHNKNTDNTGGGHYWLRSPCSYNSYYAWRCENDGDVRSSDVYSGARGVAPAFCL